MSAVPQGLTLDTGALIGIQRDNRRVVTMLRRAIQHGQPVHIVPEVLAQAWRGGPRNSRLARFVKQREVTVVSYDRWTAQAVGELAARSSHADVIDVHVALHARWQDHIVLTSDPDDLRAIDPRLPLIVV